MAVKGRCGESVPTAPEGSLRWTAVPERERFVPQRVSDLTAGLRELPWADRDNAERFDTLSRLVSAWYHYRFHERELAIVDAWEAAEEGADDSGELSAELTALLDRANYVPVTMAELDEALATESLIQLRLDVDLDDYEELLIHRRGSHRDTVEVPRWRGLRTEQRTITVDERVVVFTRVKPAAWFADRGTDPADRNLVPGAASLKQFRNVPRADIEMLLPSTQVRFRTIDSLALGVPALASGIAVLVTKLLPTLGLMFLLIAAWLGLRDDRPELDQTSLVILFGGAVTLGGFFLRQWSKLKSRRIEYLKTLSENLYFRTLADGPGVFHTLLSSAEQQEVIEVVLAYRFLLTEPDGLTAQQLDQRVEAWLRESCRLAVDFEVGDAVDKLRALDFVDGETKLRARPVAGALVALDRRWDDLFSPEPPHRDGERSTSARSRGRPEREPLVGEEP